ncbi:MAG: 4Fe-4S binding protein [Kiritimatiellae bacterium]|nr:4Fe-4S binding protein [Kiritimatiellia bacterium]
MSNNAWRWYNTGPNREYSRKQHQPHQGEKTMAHKISADKCVSCGSCKDACPAEAINEGTPYAIDPAKCVDCGACAAQCPAEAISAA